MSVNLNLIPGKSQEFRDKDYWDKFFKIRGNKAFESLVFVNFLLRLWVRDWVNT